MQNNNEKQRFDGPKTKSSHRVSSRSYLLAAIGIVVGMMLVCKIASDAALRNKAATDAGSDVVHYFSLPMLAVGAKGVYRRSMSWKQASVAGAITMFFGLFSAAVSIYLGACSNTLTDAVHLTRNTSDQDNLAACVIAGTALAMAGFAGSSISWFGVAAGWFYNANIAVASKRDENSPVHGAWMQHLTGSVYAERLEQHHPSVLSAVRSYSPKHADNVWSTARLYTNSSNSIVHVGYMVVVNSTEFNHTIITDTETLDDALTTLNRFDGKTYTPSTTIQYVNGSDNINENLTKRDSTGFWVTYTSWGENTGYEQDLLNWDEYRNSARELEYGNLEGIVQQGESCSNSYYCYSVPAKFCAGYGFSGDRGIDDAEVGEIYIKAYGGLNGDCTQG